MSIFHSLQNFFETLRQEGVSVTPSQVLDCCQALKHVDWFDRDCFYSALFSTLIKDYAYKGIFDQHFESHFGLMLLPASYELNLQQIPPDPDSLEQIAISDGDMALGSSLSRGSAAQTPGGKKNPLEQDFSLSSAEEIRRLERLFPVITRRLAAKMIKKRKKNDHNPLDFRRTLRNSMSTGGVPVDVLTSRKLREKPVILTLCDVSGSVMNFSCFSLALIAALEKFFREIHSFAFIDDIDNISGLLFSGNPLDLRTHVLKRAKVVGVSGYTDYGTALKNFRERHRSLLTHKTSVLIFGDARNNWFADETWVLQEMKKQVKKIYWFNPEPRQYWGQGDSRIYEYGKYCDQVFCCSSLLELEKALGQL